jgi:polyferredoxin
MGLITHLLMVIQNRRFYRIQKNDVEKALFHPKKDSFLWYGLRILVIILFLAIVYILAYNFHKDRLLETTLMVLGGFMTVKVVFIIVLIIFKEGR